MLKDMTTEQLAWLAGILDGEGSINISLRKRGTPKQQYSAHIAVSNTDKRMVDTIASWVGLGSLCECQRKDKYRVERHKVVWKWSVDAFSDVLMVLLKVSPYLIVKQEQATIVANFCISKLTGKCDNPEDYRMRVKALNKVGVMLTREEV